MVQAPQLTGHHIFATAIMWNPLHHAPQFRDICEAAEGKSETIKTWLFTPNVTCESVHLYQVSSQLLPSNPNTANGGNQTV